MNAQVGIIMGSHSDWATMKHAADVLTELGVAHETRIVSAHRTPDLLFEYAATAVDRGLHVIIAGAGGAAHLPGMTAAKTRLPVLGVPVQSKALSGLDSLLSIVQMPRGVPVGALAIGEAGALNAGLLAAAIVALHDPAVAARLDGYRAAQTARVLAETAAVSRGVLMPGATIGVLGGGQLGRMMAVAARQMGYRIIVLDPSPRCPTAQVADGVVVGALDDVEAARHLASQVDVITLDTEHVPADVLDALEPIAPVRPGAAVLRTIQDRLVQKQFLDRIGLPQARWAPVDDAAELHAALARVGRPAIVKVRRAGYDGKGQVRIEERSEAMGGGGPAGSAGGAGGEAPVGSIPTATPRPWSAGCAASPPWPRR